MVFACFYLLSVAAVASAIQRIAQELAMGSMVNDDDVVQTVTQLQLNTNDHPSLVSI